MIRLFFRAAPDLADAPRILRSSLFRASICSLIAVARLSWVIVRSNKFMASLNIQSGWKSSTGQMLLPATMSLIFTQIMTLKQADSLSDPLPFRNLHLCANDRLIPASQQRPSGFPQNRIAQQLLNRDPDSLAATFAHLFDSAIFSSRERLKK